MLSGGRLRLGIGVGWNSVEYEALGVDFASRGARCDEQIEVLRQLWTEDVIDFHGKYHDITHAAIIVSVCLPHAARIPIYWNRAYPVRLPLPIIHGVNASDHRFGEFGLKR